MPKNESQLTVYFDPPFWVGIYERISDETLTVAKITFGTEPKDYEVYDYLLKHWNTLSFSPPIAETERKTSPQNPKRLQRVIQAKLQEKGVGTKSQQALQLQREAAKTARKVRKSQAKEEEKARRFSQRCEKRKEKRRGH